MGERNRTRVFSDTAQFLRDRLRYLHEGGKGIARRIVHRQWFAGSRRTSMLRKDVIPRRADGEGPHNRSAACLRRGGAVRVCGGVGAQANPLCGCGVPRPVAAGLGMTRGVAARPFTFSARPLRRRHAAAGQDRQKHPGRSLVLRRFWRTGESRAPQS